MVGGAVRGGTDVEVTVAVKLLLLGSIREIGEGWLVLVGGVVFGGLMGWRCLSSGKRGIPGGSVSSVVAWLERSLLTAVGSSWLEDGCVGWGLGREG